MFWVFFILIVGLVVYISYVYNDFINVRSKISEEWETMCTNLKDRFEVFKELMDANKDVSFNSQEVIDLMDNLQKVTSKEEFVPLYQSFEKKVNEFIETIGKDSNTNILTKLYSTNSKIDFVKNFYNENVSSYNRKIDMFPSNLVAKAMNYTKDTLLP